MQHTTAPWVIVLAAGSGMRLGSLTVGDDGVVVPKQFCSLRGGRSLLLDAIDRALRIAPRDRVLVVVAADHERWWRPQLSCLPAANVIVQPRNRGTAAGILLPLAQVLVRDAEARVAVLPSDHHVDDPAVLTASLQTALACVASSPDELVLLGITPDAPDTEYGWIEPAAQQAALRAVAAFVEKPPLARAEDLLDAGALWNSFLFAANAQTLWRLCAAQTPETSAAIAAVAIGPAADACRSLAAAYDDLPTVDFSRDVLGRSAASLRVLHVPPCGWTDLGTPRRVLECLRQQQVGGRAPHRAPWFPTVDLARVAARQPAAVGA